MGYFHNHLATLVCAVFAIVLTGLWQPFVAFAAVLDFVFILAVPIMWFLVLVCWNSQKSTDYVNAHSPPYHEKKNESRPVIKTPKQELSEIKIQFSNELNSIKDAVKLKDDEIEHLNKQISNLQTMVQIESLKSELANLKALAAKTRSTRK